MKYENVNNIKKIIFSGCSVQYPAGEAEFKPAKNLEWQLIKAVLPGEPVHWIDGFLIFESWREKDQKGDYLALFRKVASNVKRQLEEFDIHGLKMDHPRSKPALWALEGNTPLESNVYDAVQIAQKGRDAFCEGRISEGLDLVLQSYKTWPDSKVLAEALICMKALPANRLEYELLSKLKEFLNEASAVIITAIAKIIALGVEKRQGINRDIIEIAVERWGNRLSNINTARSLLEGKYDTKTIKDAYAEEFVSLANSLCEYLNEIGNKSSQVDLELSRQESSILLSNIINSAFVRNAADITRDYFGSIDYLKKCTHIVDESLERAVFDFIFEFRFPVNKHFNMFPAFCAYLRNFVKRDSIKAGISNIFETENNENIKRHKIASLLQDITDIDGLRNQVEGFISKQGETLESNQAGTLGDTQNITFMTIQERLEKKPGRYPCVEDLTEGGSYSWNTEYHNDVRAKLQKNGKCLIQSNPGTGKTSLAIAVGYEFFKEGHPVYYLDLTVDSNSEELVRFVESCGKTTLVILDNVHAKIKEINSLFFDMENTGAMLLIVSRDIPKDITFTRPCGSIYDISYLDTLKKENAFVATHIEKSTLFRIIQRYIGNRSISENRVGDMDLFTKRIADYHILHFYLQEWESKGFSGHLVNIEESEVLLYIYNHYLRDCSYQKELLKVAALTQYEIDVDLKWLISEQAQFDFKVLYDGLIQLSQIGEIGSGDHISWLRVYHPVIAKYFLKAAHKYGQYVNNIDNFTFQCLSGYLSTKPLKFFKILNHLSLNHSDAFKKLIGSTAIRDVAAKIIQENATYYVHYDLESLFRFMINARDPVVSISHQWIIDGLFNPIMQHMDVYRHECIPLNVLTTVIRATELLGIPNKILSAMDFAFLGKQIKGNYNIDTVLFLLEVLSSQKISKKQINTLNRVIQFDELGKQVYSVQSERFDYCHLVNLMCYLRGNKISPKNVNKFCNSIDCQFWVETQRKGINFPCIKEFINESVSAGATSLDCCKGLDFELIGKSMLKASVSLCDLSHFLNNIIYLGFEQKKVLEFCQFLNGEVLSFSDHADSYFCAMSTIVEDMLFVKLPVSQIRCFVESTFPEKYGQKARKQKVENKTVLEFLKLLKQIRVSKNTIASFCKNAGIPISN